jgi:hypothetical protein
MAPVRNSRGSHLYVVSSKRQGTRNQRQIEVFGRSISGTLQREQVIPIGRGWVAYDVCPKAAAGSVEEFVLIGAKGVMAVAPSAQLVTNHTLLAHEKDDVLPRVKVCFSLFKGEGSSLVIPQLHGIDLFRKQGGGALLHYAQFPVRPEARYQWPVLRGASDATQRVAVRFEFPDVTAPDFNGDGLSDLCFNSSEYVSCILQDPKKGFLGGVAPLEFAISVLTSDERKNTSVRVDSRLVDVTGDGRPELVVAKSNWNLSDVGVRLYIYHQDTKGFFQAKPAQIIGRKGYFGFQEYRDHNRDGLLDIIAPVSSTSWTDIAGAYLTKKVTLDYVWYKNKGGVFDETSSPLHSLKYPVDFKNWAGLLGALPLWGVRFGQKEPGVMFFPMAERLELRTISADFAVSDSLTWSAATALGGDILAVDLNHDQKDEIVVAFPRDQQNSQTLKYFKTPQIAAKP